MSVISAAPPFDRRGTEPHPWRSRHPGLAVRTTAFALLALLGALRWAALLHPAPSGRVLGLVAIALAVMVVGPALAARSRMLAAALLAVAFLGSLAACGLPLAWIRHVRIERSGHAFGIGISSLPQLLVPYRGVDPWVRMTILAGAAVLLLDAAAILTFGLPGGRAGVGDLARAVATMPLIALAAVPLTLLPPRLAYFQGLLIFTLLAVAVWGERLPRAHRGPAAGACAVAVLLAMLLAPGLRGTRPWIDYRALSGAIAAGRTDAFDWNQTYGPLNWPQHGREVFEVKAQRPEYWKAVDLDVFDGRGWRIGSPPGTTLAPGVPAAVHRRFTETITIEIASMSTQQLIGAGETGRPVDATRIVGEGASPGTWVAATPLTAGDSYRVSVYTPHPSAHELATAGERYPLGVLHDDLSLGFGARPGSVAGVTSFPAFGSPDADLPPTEAVTNAFLLEGSAYAPVFELARRLRGDARTPYAFVQRVLGYLSHGFTYDQHPPLRPNPLANFLLTDRRGYCQQFAGAMALLLRMGGVPARVAAGFTDGQYDPTVRRWVVSDLNAHAWVEAFFPGYGWVQFDPTPRADPARDSSRLGSLLSASGSAGVNPGAAPKGATPHGLQGPGSSSTPSATGRRGGRTGGGIPWIPVVPAAVAILAAGVALWRQRAGRSRRHGFSEAERRLAELERAFARMGRPLDAGTTLGTLERRLRGTPQAAAYVAAIGRARYAPPGTDGSVPSARGALRAYLRAGLGLTGFVRALWALPPRPGVRPRSRTGERVARRPKLSG